MNLYDSTDGICDDCKEPVKDCDCDIACPKCQDGMPRRHECFEESGFCENCEGPIDECTCQPSGFYDW